MGGALLDLFARLIGYRYVSHLKRPLTLPKEHEFLNVDEIQGKTRASSATAGVFIAFSIAVLAVVMGSPEYSQALLNDILDWRRLGVSAAAVVILLYLVVRQERSLSACGNKTLRYIILFFLLCVSVFVFLVGPLRFRCESTFVGRFVSPAVLQSAFLLSSFVSLIVSALFQIFSIEFYDSASGWRGGEEKEGVALRFHLAGLASHSFLFGVSFALLGVSLLLCRIHFWSASVITLVVLLAIVAMTEIERELWERRKPSK